MKFTTLDDSRQPYLIVSEDVRFSFLEKKDLRTILKLVILKSNVQLIHDDRISTGPGEITNSILKVI